MICNRIELDLSTGTLPSGTKMKMVVINEMTEFWDESKLVVADLTNGQLLQP